MQVFSQGAAFDYGVTLSDAIDMPINLGMQFVPAGRYSNAIAFLDDVIAVYPFNETFIAGQVGHSPAFLFRQVHRGQPLGCMSLRGDQTPYVLLGPAY